MALLEALIDAGPLVAYYNASDKWHVTAQHFFESFKGKLITTESVSTEVIWLDLSIVAISERLGVQEVVSLDADFDVYRHYSKKPFNQLFPKWNRLAD